MKELPYYRVVLMPGRRWAVVHRVPGTGVDAVDLEFATLRAAQATCVGMNQQRECGWQLATIHQEKAA
jgi:hypothetical protein